MIHLSDLYNSSMTTLISTSQNEEMRPQKVTSRASIYTRAVALRSMRSPMEPS